MRDLLLDATEHLRAAKIESARADARILWQHAARQDDVFQKLIARRLAHEPVAYITGHKEFWSLDFEVGRGVLIPRPETETLIEQVLREMEDRTYPYRILDLGTGSGCLLVTLLSELPNASGVGVDISAEALVVAKRNVRRHGLSDRASLVLGEWDAAPGRFDLVVANPPYVKSCDLAGLPPDVRDHEPAKALNGGLDGLDAYRAIGSLLSRYISPRGAVFLEIGASQLRLVARIMEEAGLELTRTVPDLAGVPRCLVARHRRGSETLAQKKVGNLASTR